MCMKASFIDFIDRKYDTAEKEAAMNRNEAGGTSGINKISKRSGADEAKKMGEMITGEMITACEENESHFTYKKADLSDIDLLTKTRIEVLRAANGLAPDADMSVVERETRQYCEDCLADGSHVAYLVFDGDKWIGTGGISFYRVMPIYRNPIGWKAYVMNMYTDPDYRRRGIAYRTLDLLVREARERGISFITLEATKMGRPLYERYGFEAMGNEMKLPASKL